MESSIAGLTARQVETSRGTVFVQSGGSGPALLLLHGFPETSVMWHAVAPTLAGNFSVIAADLPGYGLSSCPPDREGHVAMSKREMAATLVEAMHVLGYDQFAIVGHDRGGRVASRAALDHPNVIAKLVVLDVVPTPEVWARADARLMLAFWPFSLLAQPAPLPERVILAAPDAIVDNALKEWGSDAGAFPAWVRQSYIEALRDPEHVHAICEEYRAASTVDREHDQADLDAGKRITCPLSVLWSESGGVAHWYKDAGGPLGLWRRWADDLQGQAMKGGHFFPEEYPEMTAEIIQQSMRR